MNSAFSPDQSVLSFRSSAQLLHGRSAADLSPAYVGRSTLPRPVYESSFWTSKEIYETSHSRRWAQQRLQSRNSGTIKRDDERRLLEKKKQREVFRRTALTVPPRTRCSATTKTEKVCKASTIRTRHRRPNSNRYTCL